ncbi:hypothetical protein AMJ57_00155 [Parcubacteria bacterium SG8_24]|nr:MAG: hypothetical protein AMJ57_00155 [Parcubacteria bacterium SG8_24]
MGSGKYLTVLLGSLLLLGVGCVSFSTGGTSTMADGGLFKSGDRGETWQQKTAVLTVGGEARNFSNTNAATIVQDPADARALYMGTSENGLFYSHDAGESWSQPAQLNRGRIASVTVNPKDKCDIYVTTENKVMKSRDCARSWTTTYLDPRPEKKMVAVVVDHFNPNIVWTANDAGDVLKSTDAGESWANVVTMKSPVMRILMNAVESRRLYVATKNTGIWRTDDGGANWQDLSEVYRSFSGSMEFMDMVLGVSDPNTVIFASKYGLLRSTNGGDEWESIELLTTPGSTAIYSVTVDPKDVNNIYYGTATTFYRSQNGGVNWVPKKLPSSRAATFLLVDSLNPSTVYMGVTRFKK